MTVNAVEEGDVLSVAVPLTPQFRRLADKWRKSPLVMRSGVQIVLVGREGTVEGLHLG
jgi:hypothetical protein